MNTRQALPHIMIFCVTYKSYDYLRTFMTSVERAAAKAEGLCHVTLCVGDNTTDHWEDVPADLTPHCSLHAFPYHLNLGYLGCALKMMSETGWNQVGDANYTIISNVDLTLDENFFSTLISTPWTTDAGWLAPDIFTPRLNHHDNPFQMRRPLPHDFLRWKILYSHPLVYELMERVYHLRNKRQIPHTQQEAIYAGHGSLMLFTSQFMKKHADLRFPAFMYGEELFLAELVRRDGLRTYYCPSLHVSNVGRVSTGNYNYAWLCRQNRQSLRTLRNLYFR